MFNAETAFETVLWSFKTTVDPINDKTRNITNINRKIKNKTLAILKETLSAPRNPKKPEMIAITRKTMAHVSMITPSAL